MFSLIKKLRLILFFLLFLQCTKDDVVEPAKTAVVKTFGGSKNDVLQSVVKTSDGGYAVLGYTQSNDFDISNKSNESYDFWVMKFSSDNTLLWQHTYGGSDNDRGTDIIATNDGGFALLGFSKSDDVNVSENAGAQDVWLIKLTQNGLVSWQKSFGYSGADIGTALLQTSDNGFLITGVLDVSASNGQGNAKTTQKHAGGDVWVIKLDHSGNLVWSRFFGGSFTDTPFGVVETANNSYLIAASSDSNDFNISNNKGSYDFWILNIANTGDLLWEKNFGGSEIDEPRGITLANDNNIVIVGDTRSTDQDITNNYGGADLWLLKIDVSGNKIWEKNFGGSSFDVARSISKTKDNGFIISGNSRSIDFGFINQGKNDAWMLKVDDSGNKIWQKFVGGSQNEFLFDAIQLNNQSIIAVGESSSADKEIPENKGFSDALIINLK